MSTSRVAVTAGVVTELTKACVSFLGFFLAILRASCYEFVRSQVCEQMYA